MRFLVLFVAMFALCAGPVLAQDAPDAAREHHLDLAGRYLELTQGADSAKLLREYIEQGFGGDELPDDQRSWLADQFTALFQKALDAAITEARDDVADNFTLAELEAVVAFYETPMGRSIARKNLQAGMALQQAMTPHLVTGMTSLGEKFCQRFDCGDPGQAAAKSGR
jgi:hypothetical protein